MVRSITKKILMVTVLNICTVIFIKNGIFLKSIELKKFSTCEDWLSEKKYEFFYPKLRDTFKTSTDLNNCADSPVKNIKKMIFVLLDAVRYDFVKQNFNYEDTKNGSSKYYKNILTIFEKSVKKSPERAKLFRFIADPPTATTQRVKALMTGGNPHYIEFLDVKGFLIKEDNILRQMTANKLKSVFLGDFIWNEMFPQGFARSYCFHSLNPSDIYSNDKNIKANLDRELASEDWDALFLHYLAVDHVGHTFGPDTVNMREALRKLNKAAAKLISKVDTMNETIVFFVSDHGMVESGNHGQGTDKEKDAFIFAYTSKDLYFRNNELNSSVPIRQTSFVGTASILFGIPKPFKAIGKVIADLLPFREADKKAEAGNPSVALSTEKRLTAISLTDVLHSLRLSQELEIKKKGMQVSLQMHKITSDFFELQKKHFEAQKECAFELEIDQETVRICVDKYKNLSKEYGILSDSILWIFLSVHYFRYYNIIIGLAFCVVSTVFAAIFFVQPEGAIPSFGLLLKITIFHLLLWLVDKGKYFLDVLELMGCLIILFALVLLFPWLKKISALISFARTKNELRKFKGLRIIRLLVFILVVVFYTKTPMAFDQLSLDKEYCMLYIVALSLTLYSPTDYKTYLFVALNLAGKLFEFDNLTPMSTLVAFSLQFYALLFALKYVFRGSIVHRESPASHLLFTMPLFWAANYTAKQFISETFPLFHIYFFNSLYVLIPLIPICYQLLTFVIRNTFHSKSKEKHEKFYSKVVSDFMLCSLYFGALLFYKEIIPFFAIIYFGVYLISLLKPLDENDGKFVTFQEVFLLYVIGHLSYLYFGNISKISSVDFRFGFFLGFFFSRAFVIIRIYFPYFLSFLGVLLLIALRNKQFVNGSKLLRKSMFAESVKFAFHTFNFYNQLKFFMTVVMITLQKKHRSIASVFAPKFLFDSGVCIFVNIIQLLLATILRIYFND